MSQLRYLVVVMANGEARAITTRGTPLGLAESTRDQLNADLARRSVRYAEVHYALRPATPAECALEAAA